MTKPFADRESVMRRAIDLARCGIGSVEPNPPVGAVLVDDELKLIAEGYHEQFGGPHAEINALRQAGDCAAGATLFVTLEPCCHQGKTGPCTRALIDAKVKRVIIAVLDPSKHSSGRGIDELKNAGVEVETGFLETEAGEVIAAFVKRVKTGLPYVHAKWAMSLDGKIASRGGMSQWISNTASREVVHRLRGRMDAIIVGAKTVTADDPLLTARPPGPRTATRIAIDTHASLSLESQLVRTCRDAPVLVVAGMSAAAENIERLQSAGVEVLQLPPDEIPPAEGEGTESPPISRPGMKQLLLELGSREMTNVLVEGGGELLGAFFDRRLIDEVHVFVAPKLIGGNEALSPLGGLGLETIPNSPQIHNATVEVLDGDVYIHGRLTDGEK